MGVKITLSSNLREEVAEMAKKGIRAVTYPTAAIVHFCAEEVERQQRGPIQVAWMVDAWEYARLEYGKAKSARRRVWGAPPLGHWVIQHAAHLIEHEANTEGQWRSVGVRVGDRICPAVNELPGLMSRWSLNLTRGMGPDEAYKEFEMIHPFRDGNGRVGKIIYNWLRGTLDDPQMPPNFFGVANP